MTSSSAKKRYVAAARGSRLSLAQAGLVMEQLRVLNPNCTYETAAVTTRGDIDERPLFTIDQKGIFAKEVDRAVADGAADFAIHSLKDLPAAVPDGLVLASVPKREQPADILITQNGDTLEGLPRNSTIGTSSLRRAVQISRARPDIMIKPIRGNIETRIRRVGSDVDGIVLAYAGVARLGLKIRYEMLPLQRFVPSPGQGALAVVCRSDDLDTREMLGRLEDRNSRAEADAERALSETVGSGCRFPVGALARCHDDDDDDDGTLTLTADAFSTDGREVVTTTVTLDAGESVEAGRQAGKDLISKGVKRLALNWREGLSEWNRA